MCAPGLYCQYTGENTPAMQPIGECTAVKAIGEDCEENYSCSDGYCQGGTCTTPSLGSTCGYRRQGNFFEPTVCPTGSACYYEPTCKAYLSLGDECRESKRPCPPDSICHQATPNGPWHCAASAELHEECSDEVCVQGTFCVNAPAP